MKTVPTVRLADTADVVAFPDLPEEIALAMTDIAALEQSRLLGPPRAALLQRYPHLGIDNQN